MINGNEENGKVALVFGISGDQGQAVATGLLTTGSYRLVYGATRDVSPEHVDTIAKHISVPVRREDEVLPVGGVAEYVTIIEADLNSAASIKDAFVRTRATDIFLVTTTDGMYLYY